MNAKHFSFVSYRDLRELVDTAAERYPNTEFFISSDKLLPYITGLQLRHCCCAFAHIMRSEGRQGEHIAVLGRNCAAWIAAFFSIVTGGCVAVPLSVDAKGDVFFTGRRKNLIVLPNGENVSPEELEEKLYRIDGVEDALVSQDGGVICAEVHADAEIIPDTEALQRVIDRLNESLPMFKQIGRITLRKEPFEKTSTQKIKRRGA